MANFIEGFPSYGTQEEKDLWFQRFAEQHNQLATTGTGGGGGTLTSGVQVNEDNEVIDTNRPGERLGWAEIVIFMFALQAMLMDRPEQTPVTSRELSTSLSTTPMTPQQLTFQLMLTSFRLRLSHPGHLQ